MALGFLNPFGDNFLGSGSSISRQKEAERRYGGVDPTGAYGQTAADAATFGRQSAGGFGALGTEAAAQRDELRRRAAGQDSMSAEQLRQGLAQISGQQIGMAAGRPVGGQAAAARQASMNVANAGAGLAGQQAMAGIAERQAASDALTNAILQQRGQQLQATLGGQQNALSGYGGIEQNRTNRFGAMLGTPTPAEQALGGLGGLIGGAARVFSDRRLKKDIIPAEEEADRFMTGLKNYRWKYRNEADGHGEFVTPMAQDLEKSRAGRAAVVETPRGKAVDTARLAMALAGAAGRLHRRVKRLEGRRGRAA